MSFLGTYTNSHDSAFYKIIRWWSSPPSKSCIWRPSQQIPCSDFNTSLEFHPFHLIVSTAFFIFTEVLTIDNYPTSSVTVSINPFHRQGSFHADLMKFLVVNNTLLTICLEKLSPTSISFVLFNKDFHQLVPPLFCSITKVEFPSQRTFTNQLLCRRSTEAWSTSRCGLFTTLTSTSNHLRQKVNFTIENTPHSSHISRSSKSHLDNPTNKKDSTNKRWLGIGSDCSAHWFCCRHMHAAISWLLVVPVCTLSIKANVPAVHTLQYIRNRGVPLPLCCWHGGKTRCDWLLLAFFGLSDCWNQPENCHR